MPLTSCMVLDTPESLSGIGRGSRGNLLGSAHRFCTLKMELRDRRPGDIPLRGPGTLQIVGWPWFQLSLLPRGVTQSFLSFHLKLQQRESPNRPKRFSCLRGPATGSVGLLWCGLWPK